MIPGILEKHLHCPIWQVMTDYLDIVAILGYKVSSYILGLRIFSFLIFKWLAIYPTVQ